MKWTGERVIPWTEGVHPYLMYAHIIRYAWATQVVRGARVCDLGCGAGYGSFLLSWVARDVVGVDVSEETIEYARTHFQADNLRFEVCDLERDAIPEAECYTAFEVLEHLKDPKALVAKLNAPCVWSFPVLNGSPFHKHICSVTEIRAMLPGAIGYQSAQGGIGSAIPLAAEDGYVIGIEKGET